MKFKRAFVNSVLSMTINSPNMT